MSDDAKIEEARKGKDHLPVLVMDVKGVKGRIQEDG